MKNLQDFKDALSKECYGETTKDAQAKDICIQCKEPALPKCHSDAGRKEYQISGLCEVCFDEITKKPDEEDKEGCCSCHINPPCSYCVGD